MARPLVELRNAAVAYAINTSIKQFLAGERTRPCAYCGTKFKPHSRYHFFDSADCRRGWYRGVFHPKPTD